MDLVPTTELDAINEMLATIGESPVNRVDAGVVDAVNARKLLRTTSRRVQSKGWHWNTEKFTLSPTTPDGFLVVPANALQIDTIEQDEDKDLVRRGGRLYDLQNNTFVFTAPVRVEMVLLLDFADLSEPARNFITMSSCRKFQEQSLGSPEISRLNQRDEMLAWRDLMDAEGREADLNVFKEFSVARILDR